MRHFQKLIYLFTCLVKKNCISKVLKFTLINKILDFNFSLSRSSKSTSVTFDNSVDELTFEDHVQVGTFVFRLTNTDWSLEEIIGTQSVV